LEHEGQKSLRERKEGVRRINTRIRTERKIGEDCRRGFRKNKGGIRSKRFRLHLGQGENENSFHSQLSP
jgi:hypothetical protein